MLFSLLLTFLPLTTEAGNTTVCSQENAYGGIIADISTGQNIQPRLYNGKELDRTNNLWWYDYGARIGGSGGIISWDTTGTILPTTHGGVRNSILDLSHEMSHAADSNKGLLDSRIENGIKRSEWQAVYHENIIRSQLGIPLRTYYKVKFTSSGDFLGGDGPYLLDSANNPIKPHWY